MDELQERLTELEIRFTHQTLLVEELNEVVITCMHRIERLEQDSRAYREMLGGLGPDFTESPDE